MFFITSKGYSQECGPNCPACSGGSSGGIIAKNNLLVSALAMPTSDDEYAVANIRYGVLNWMDAGVGYAFKAKDPIWSLRIQPLAENEDKWYPGVIVGTGSVRTGGSDQSVYGMITKTVEFSESFALQGYVGAASVFKDFENPFFLSGLSAIFLEKLTVFGSYDGLNFHEGLAWTATDNLTLSAMMIETRYPSLSVSYRFDLGN
ncbi:MAG: hypothetical protein KBH36_01275 [Acidaminococcaceae bacterium]|nr:hypothetical protein [Acidaminococcaceae bacterium]